LQKGMYPVTTLPQDQAEGITVDGISRVSRDEQIVDKSTSISKQSSSKMNNRVFIVHGYNETIKEKTARLITSVGLKPIILSEQPNQGKTIVEKFEKNSDFSFAVILMTADDLGDVCTFTKKRPIESKGKAECYFRAWIFHWDIRP
jgi:hypothetical protein